VLTEKFLAEDREGFLVGPKSDDEPAEKTSEIS